MPLVALIALTLGAGPSDEALARLLEEGAALSAQGDHQGALAVFERAHALQPQAFGPLFNVGVELEALGRTGSAWLRFVDARAVAEKAGDARAAKAVRKLEALQPKLAWVSVEGELPAGATVRIQGEVAAGSPPQRPVDPGVVEVSVQAAGFAPWSQAVPAPAQGRRVTVRVPLLEPLGRAPPREDVPRAHSLEPTPPVDAPAPVAAAVAPPPSRVAGLSLLVAGTTVALAAFVGLLVGASTLGELERQRVGAPGSLTPSVSLATAQTLAWALPLAWLGLGAGSAAAVAGGFLAWGTR